MSQYNSILVAVDYSDHVDKVIERAVDQAQRNAAIIHLVHIVEFVPPMIIGDEPFSVAAWSVDEEALMSLAKKRMEEIVSGFGGGLSLTTHIEMGRAVVEICRLANELGCDLIIAGSHGRSGLNRLLGSTASALVHQVPGDLLLIKIK